MGESMVSENKVFEYRRSKIISSLQKIQNQEGYISKDAICNLSRVLGITPSEIWGVATFYPQFKFYPPARHTIKVCLGTSCYLKGGKDILDILKSKFGIEVGEITSDKRFALEELSCNGCCAHSPVVVIDDDVYGKVSKSEIDNILEKYE